RSSLFAQKYSDKYLHNHYENGSPSGGRIEYVRLFSLIAIFVMVIACINFMNLSTAKSTGRLKESGIRKVMGASRISLVVQHISESMFMSFLSLVIAVLITILLLPQFNIITGKQISFRPNADFILIASGCTLFTGLLSGIYPALYLSGFNLTTVLK